MLGQRSWSRRPGCLPPFECRNSWHPDVSLLPVPARWVRVVPPPPAAHSSDSRSTALLARETRSKIDDDHLGSSGDHARVPVPRHPRRPPRAPRAPSPPSTTRRPSKQDRSSSAGSIGRSLERTSASAIRSPRPSVLQRSLAACSTACTRHLHGGATPRRAAGQVDGPRLRARSRTRDSARCAERSSGAAPS